MKRLGLIILILGLAGCTALNLVRTAPGATPSARVEMPVPPADTPLPYSSPDPAEGTPMVAVSLHVDGDPSTRPELINNTEIQVVAEFDPVIVNVLLKEDGSLLSTGWQPWQDHPVTEMRTCLSAEGECQPQGEWQPYTSQVIEVVAVTWLGEREIFLAAEFRDASGVIIPAGSLADLAEQPGMVGRATLQTIAYANPDEVAGQTPSPQVLTAIARTKAAFPVTGSLLLEDGRCCAGGTAGSQVEVNATFRAESPAGKVTTMRVSTAGGCLRDAASLDAPWEPFAEGKQFTPTLAINWVGFYVNVQFRDEAGNLSAVYCDDISMEGSPAQTP